MYSKKIDDVILSDYFHSINYIYVTDENERLIGVLSLKELFRTAKSKTAKEIMKTYIRSATDE